MYHIYIIIGEKVLDGMRELFIFILTAALFFVLQQQLIRRCDRKALQLIPICLISAAYAVAVALCIVDYFTGQGVLFKTIVALLIAALATAALIGAGIAWLYEKV